MTRSAEDVRSDVERAAILCEMHRHADAVTLLRRTLATNPDAAECWAQLAVAHLGCDQPQLALEAAVRAAGLAPDFGWPLRLISVAMLKLDRKHEAVMAARRAVSTDPFDWACQVQLALALLSDQQVSGARTVANQAAALAPDDAVTHLLLADVARAEGRYSDAEQHVRRALEINPTSAQTLSALATVELRKFAWLNPSKLAKFSTKLASAIRSDPRDSALREQLDTHLTLLLIIEVALLGLSSGVVLRLLDHNDTLAARVTPIALLAVPLLIAAHVLRKVPVAVRGRLSQLLRERRLLPAVAFESLAIAANIAAAIAPLSLRLKLVGVAAGASFWAMFTLRRHLRRTTQSTDR